MWEHEKEPETKSDKCHIFNENLKQKVEGYLQVISGCKKDLKSEINWRVRKGKI